MYYVINQLFPRPGKKLKQMGQVRLSSSLGGLGGGGGGIWKVRGRDGKVGEGEYGRCVVEYGR